MFLSKRNGIYYLWYDAENGRRRKVSTHATTKREALAFIKTFIPREAAVARMPMAQYIEEFHRYATSTYSPKTVELFKRALADFSKAPGSLPLQEITPRHVDQYKARRLAVVSPTTVNIEMRALHSTFNTAVRWEVISVNPFCKVKAPSIVETTPVYLSREEYARLVGAIDQPWLKELVEFALLTGMRRGEILNLKWKQVDLQRRVVIVQSNPTFKTKTGRMRVVPLADGAVNLLARKAARAGLEYVFTFDGRPFKGDHVIRN